MNNGSILGIDETKKIRGKDFERPWPPLIKMDENVKAKLMSCLRGIPVE